MKKIAGYMLRPKFSTLWVLVCTGCALSYSHIGWWSFVWCIGLAVPVTLAEVFWEMRNERG